MWAVRTKRAIKLYTLQVAKKVSLGWEVFASGGRNCFLVMRGEHFPQSGRNITDRGLKSSRKDRYYCTYRIFLQEALIAFHSIEL